VYFALSEDENDSPGRKSKNTAFVSDIINGVI